MRTKLLFDNLDASQFITSDSIQIDKRCIWKLIIDTQGLNGTPTLFIEEAYNGGGCLPEPNEYYLLRNECEDKDGFDLSDSVITIEKDKLIGNWIRIRLDPNDNTEGIVRALFVYKSFP